MSDLPVELPPTNSPDPGAGSDPIGDPTSPDLGNAPDPEFLALVEKLGPVFVEVANAAVQAALDAMPVTTWKPATVTAVGGYGQCSIRADGDDNPIDAQVLGETPVPGQRVMAVFVPPSSILVIGAMDGRAGVPPSTICSYTGPIAVRTQTSATAQKTPPFGWFWAYGQIERSSDAPLLYQEITTLYNTGGENAQLGEFRVPDMRGRMPIGMDNMGGTDAGRITVANAVGTTAGAQTHTTPLPAHTHSQPTHTHSESAHTHSMDHTHSMGSHSHSFSGSTSGVGDHAHGVYYGDNTQGAGAWSAMYSSTTFGGLANPTTGAGGHSHSFSGTTGGASGTTGGASSTTTGSGGSGTTGAGGGDTTGSAGVSSIDVDHLPPVMVVHWIIKC